MINYLLVHIKINNICTYCTIISKIAIQYCIDELENWLTGQFKSDIKICQKFQCRTVQYYCYLTSNFYVRLNEIPLQIATFIMFISQFGSLMHNIWEMHGNIIFQISVNEGECIKFTKYSTYSTTIFMMCSITLYPSGPSDSFNTI